jgi:spore coat protein U-like protein
VLTGPNPTATDATGNIQVSCSLIGLISLLVSYDILLSPGGSGSYTPREMTSGTNHLQYNLYTNTARTTVWGDGNSGTATVSDGYLLGIGTTMRNYSIYGALPSSQNMPAGTYADTITVTVNY